MVNRLLIVKLIYLSILLTGCHGSVADEEGRTESLQSNHVTSASQGAMQGEGNNIASGNFQLVRGKQYALCRDFLRNLELYADEQPMICDRKYHPSLTKFQKPKWEEVDPRDYRHLLKQMFLMANAPSQDSLKDKRDLYEKRWEAYVNGDANEFWFNLPLEKKLEQGVIRVWRGHFDIVYEGIEEDVLKVAFWPGCDREFGHYLTSRRQTNYYYYVMNDENEINLEYWRIANSSRAGDLVFYDGRIRHVRWRAGYPGPDGKMWTHGGIVISEPGATKEPRSHFEGKIIDWPGVAVCGFEYVPHRTKEDDKE